MKRIFGLLILLIVFCFVSFAQGEFKMGLRIGPNFSTLYGVRSDGIDAPTLFSAKENYRMKAGVRGGFVFDVSLTDVISLQPAIYYSYQRMGTNGKYDYSDSLVLTTAEVLSMHIIQIPVMVNFSMHFKNNYNNAFVLGVGPYFSVALHGMDEMTGVGNDKYTGETYGVRGQANFYKNEQISYFITDRSGYAEKEILPMENHPYNRCDFGFSFNAGFQLSKFYIGAGCDLGVINSANQKEWENLGVNNYVQRNLNVNILVGYNF